MTIYTKTTNWQQTREAVLRRDNFKCRHCEKGINEVDIHTHHASYLFGDHPAYLVALCVKCHGYADADRELLLSQMEWHEMHPENFLPRWIEAFAKRMEEFTIVTGTSTSQREHMMALRDIIRNLSHEQGDAHIGDIVRLAEAKGMDSKRVVSLLTRWSSEGEVYSPNKNRYKLVGGR